MEWKNAVQGIPLDFGNLSNPRLCAQGQINHIRVTFRDVGYWSLVGTDSIRLIDQQTPSLNLQNFDTAPPNNSEFQATVLHEFGHALGLQHEHQNPLSKCREEFDWPKIYARLGAPPNNWSKEKVDFNMGVLNEPGLYATTFDSKSIMLYTFPPSYFKNGSRSSCYHPTNTVVSDGDKNIMAQLYPNSTDARIVVATQIRDWHFQQIQKSGKAEGAKSAVLQIINEYLPARP
jgi:hypothetical protein